MKILTAFLFVLTLVASSTVRAQTYGAGGEGVAVGTSDLIGTVQDSDTFTIGSDSSTGTRNGESYSVGAYPLSTQDALLESAYDNSQSSPSWETTAFSLNNDANYVDVTTNGAPFFQTYPGSSGAGSATGFTQTGLGASTTETSGMITITHTEDHSIAYGAGTNFVVQADAVQLNDRIDINIGNTQDTVLSSDGLSVFFRTGGGSNSIGLYNVTLGETEASFVSTNITANEWNNYAVGFNLSTDTLSIYTNEVLDGTINLATFDGGAYAAVLDVDSADFVGVGGHVSTTNNDQDGLLWTDNFEVGLAAPEPGTWAMLLGGIGVLAGITRLRRLNA
jgi:hypothetical protein